MALTYIGSLASTASAQYGGFWDNTEITKFVTATLAYDSNIANNSSEVGDTIARANASVQISRRLNEQIRLGVDLNAVAAYYFDNDRFNHNDIFLNWIIDTGEEIGNRRLRFSFNADLSESTRSENELQGQVKERSITAGIEADYMISRQLSLGAAVNYRKRDPQSNVKRFDEDLAPRNSSYVYGNETLSYSARLSWIARENLSYRLSISRQETDSDRTDYQYNNGNTDSITASMIGQISAKLSGTFSVGYSERSYSGGTQTTPTASLSLRWTIDELSSIGLTGSQRLGTSLNGANTDGKTLSISYQRRFNRRLSGNISGSISKIEYTFPETRVSLDPESEDIVLQRVTNSDSYSISAGLNYMLTERSSLGANFNWSDYSSDFRYGVSTRLRGGVTYRLNF